jgi:hypothetical protein
MGKGRSYSSGMAYAETSILFLDHRPVTLSGVSSDVQFPTLAEVKSRGMPLYNSNFTSWLPFSFSNAPDNGAIHNIVVVHSFPNTLNYSCFLIQTWPLQPPSTEHRAWYNFDQR